SAHTKFEASTGSIHAMCYDFKRGYRLSYVEIGADNRLAQHTEIKLPSQSMVHDCALTEHYIVVFDLSITFSPSRLIRRYFPFAWNPKHQARIGLLHRKDLSKPITWFEIAPCYIFHAMNAFEDSTGRVILEAMRYERIFDQNKLGPFGEALPYPTRWTMDVGTGSVTEDQFDDRASEFPRVHPDLEGTETQFGYALGVGREVNALDFNQILKYHRRDDHVAVHQLAPAKMASEPVFVPKAGARAEDEGYLLSYIFDQEKSTSELMILDAQNISEEPLAQIELPQRVPFGFHGSWVPA
ncbi:MAG: carotenoid oxygenase family protein, partial [Pseudomonadales bacterium]|nr:carotenoid oxygenase family protein [Pseudomonadales bacterium]